MGSCEGPESRPRVSFNRDVHVKRFADKPRLPHHKYSTLPSRGEGVAMRRRGQESRSLVDLSPIEERGEPTWRPRSSREPRQHQPTQDLVYATVVGKQTVHQSVRAGGMDSSVSSEPPVPSPRIQRLIAASALQSSPGPRFTTTTTTSFPRSSASLRDAKYNSSDELSSVAEYTTSSALPTRAKVKKAHSFSDKVRSLFVKRTSSKASQSDPVNSRYAQYQGESEPDLRSPRKETWFQSLDRKLRGRPKDKAPTRIYSRANGGPPAQGQGKNLRFFGESDDSEYWAVRPKPRQRSLANDSSESDSGLAPRLGWNKGLRNGYYSTPGLNTDYGYRVEERPRKARSTTLHNGLGVRPDLRHESSGDTSGTDTSTGRSHRSVVYLHSAAVRDIPGSRRIKRHSSAASSLISERLAEPVRRSTSHVTRSFSMLGPWSRREEPARPPRPPRAPRPRATSPRASRASQVSRVPDPPPSPPVRPLRRLVFTGPPKTPYPNAYSATLPRQTNVKSRK